MTVFYYGRMPFFGVPGTDRERVYRYSALPPVPGRFADLRADEALIDDLKRASAR